LTLTLTFFSQNTQVKTAAAMVATVVVVNLSSIEREGVDQRLLISSQILCLGEGGAQ